MIKGKKFLNTLNQSFSSMLSNELPSNKNAKVAITMIGPNG